jgi:hypothetical protein
MAFNMKYSPLSQVGGGKSPLNYGKGCAETKEGCIREGSGSEPFYILNNKKGGVWTEGGRFKTRDAAKAKLAAIHIN